ncbi:hypothetical protein L484_013383 [Morus notabilis]|uniref:Uncharacterized protein n=1 Tax=Morus notabilis TaxID=981085 RepID=W9R9L6_9ROSA|nr:uncharacterized protein LOC21396556 [Morus notabilis]EXB60118.1 hypothetical protein L484_013383 [Morus notabilis]
MGVDDSFKKPGSVPFKWEIKPGVPKVQSQQQQTKQQPPLQEPPSPLRKLRPPPAGLVFVPPPPEARSLSFRSSSRTRSERWRFERPEIVTGGCFPANPLLRRKGNRKRETTPESDYAAELETLARWSVSSRKTLLSSFRDSTSSPSSSFSSHQSSPRPVNDAEWAGFGLF